MNKLLTYTGGQPFNLEDLNFMDEAIRETFVGLLKGFLDTNYIISGCGVTEVAANGLISYTCSQGWIFLNNEIRRVEAHSISGSENEICYFTENNYFDPLGNKNFKDRIPRDCYEIREAHLVIGNPPTGYLAFNSSFRLKNAFQADVQNQIDSLENAQSGLNGRVGTLEGGQSNLSGRVGTLEGGQTSLGGRVGTLETGQAALGTRVGALETGQSNLNTAVSALNLKDTDLQNQISGLDERIDVLEAEDSWHIVGAAGEIQYNAGFVAGSTNELFNIPFQYKKASADLVLVKGSFYQTGGDILAFTLPEYVRPTNDVFIMYKGTISNAYLRIETNGQVSLDAGTPYIGINTSYSR